MTNKQRLSASIDSDLIEAVEDAVARGHSGSVSAWVNDALRLKLEHDRRLEALSAFIKDYESKFGEITPEEMRRAARRCLGSPRWHSSRKIPEKGCYRCGSRPSCIRRRPFIDI